MLDLLLIASLGFLGSFGHCMGMCGPIAIAFSLSKQEEPSKWQQFRFHLLLSVGRIFSYALVGAGIGALGSVVIAGGQLAGIGSALRQGIAIAMGIVLIGLGLAQIMPQQVPRLPFLHPFTQGQWHDRLNRAMVSLSFQQAWWTPALLGLAWGLIPCGFLYTAQVKAAETGSILQGSLTMLAFGVGTLPIMVGIGIGGALMKPERRNQLFRLGGWVTLLIGILTLSRTGEMQDFTGYASLVCLMLALIARPLNQVMAWLLPYRRIFGIASFVLAIAHAGHMLTMGWDLQAIPFLVPLLQAGTLAGLLSLGLLTPPALTSFNTMKRLLGRRWRLLHLLSIPAFLLAVLHIILLGPNFLGAIEWSWMNWAMTGILGAIALGVLLIRQSWFWTLLSLEKFYGFPAKRKHSE